MSAPNGSEGTRDALLPASPVPERQATGGVDRKSGRPAISCTGLFAYISSLLPAKGYRAAVFILMLSIMVQCFGIMMRVRERRQQSKQEVHQQLKP